MSEVIDRMIARTFSDIKRGVPFDEGMRHWAELVKETLVEMDRKILKMEKIAERIEGRR